jgi:hypothetical protein
VPALGIHGNQAVIVLVSITVMLGYDFQTVEIQWFAKDEMNSNYLLDSVIDCNFANKISPCV